MYTEFACYHEQDIKEVQKQVFEALEYPEINGISVPVLFLNDLSKYIPEGITISCPINWPLGKATTKVRNHSVLSAINRGANTIDLVSSDVLFKNNEERYCDDIQSNMGICYDKGVRFRLFTDYRNMSQEEMSRFFGIVKDLGVEYIFPSNGYGVDDYVDNLLVALHFQKELGMFSITNGNIFNSKQYTNVCKSEIYGIRLHNIKSVTRLLSGV